MNVSNSLKKSLINYNILRILGEGSFGKALLVKSIKGKVFIIIYYIISYFFIVYPSY